jgi:hypothetical protein
VAKHPNSQSLRKAAEACRIDALEPRPVLSFQIHGGDDAVHPA